jgi:hypothetical protein
MEESSYSWFFIYFVFSMFTWLQIAPWNKPTSVRRKKQYRIMQAVAVFIWPLFWSYFFYHLIKHQFKKT